MQYEKLYYYKIMKALINDKIVEIGNREMASVVNSNQCSSTGP